MTMTEWNLSCLPGLTSARGGACGWPAPGQVCFLDDNPGSASQPRTCRTFLSGGGTLLGMSAQLRPGPEAAL